MRAGKKLSNNQQATSKVENNEGATLNIFGFVVEVGCPPELVLDGGHPIPLICRGKKRFVKGYIWITEYTDGS